MEWSQITIGAVVTVLGILAYLAAVDVVTSLPGNFLFFGGVLIMTWGSENPAAKGFFTLALLSLIFIVACVVWMICMSRAERTSQPRS